jgi:pyridine nucleotide-disulfide oxidoreductase family protein
MQPPHGRDVVLLGAGHTNAQVVLAWRDRPMPGARLTCVSNHDRATYSGMLPGVLAGQYPRERMEIDLARLCASVGAQFVADEVCGLDVSARRLLFASRQPLPFDVLSIGIGSVPSFDGVEVDAAAPLVPVKPMQSLLARLDERLRAAADARRGAPVRAAVVGGGAGGVEIALALPHRAHAAMGGAAPFQVTIVSADESLVPGCLEGTRRRVERVLSVRGVRALLGQRVVAARLGHLQLDGGGRVEADLVVWATGATAPPLVKSLGLPLDGRGFLLTADTLQVASGHPVFAVGDTGSIAGMPLPKAGVYAVRQGPVLWENIERLLSGRPLRRYEPQRDFLKLINTADGRAIGEWKGLSFEGAWCWRLKDAIDRRFIGRFQGRASS